MRSPRHEQHACHGQTASGPHPFEAVLSGRGLAVAGVLLMLLGCACFIDLSFSRGWIAPLWRIALGIVAGSALIAGAARFMRGAYRSVAEATIALGAGIFSVAAWASFAVFPELHVPQAAAFAALSIAAFALAFIADRSRSQPVALMGLLAAYLTPVLSNSIAHDQEPLAGYLLLVTSAMLVLARRRSFVAVEVTASLATLAYGFALAPNPSLGWSNGHAASAASLFFVLFAAAFTTRPGGDRSRALHLAPLVVTTALYISILTLLFGPEPGLLGSLLLGLATLLFAAPALSAFPREMKLPYRSLGLLAVNLALRSLLERTELFDAFAVQAAVLAVLGARTANATITRIGIGLFGVAAAGLGWEMCTLPPAETAFSPFAIALYVWLASAFSARRAIPENLRRASSLLAHAVALAGLTRIGLDATGGPAWNAGVSGLALATMSLIWATFGAALFARGVSTRDSVLRWEGLAIFAVTIVKVFSFDLAGLDLTYRILAFAGTGAVLFVSSAWYTRSLRTSLGRAA